MPIPKESLEIHGEHLLADDNGMLPAEGETLADLTFAIHPANPGSGPRHQWPPAPEADHGGSPVLYENEAHYLAAVATARSRAATAAQMDADNALGPTAVAERNRAAAEEYHAKYQAGQLP